jgi:hypothetical protein
MNAYLIKKKSDELYRKKPSSNAKSNANSNYRQEDVQPDVQTNVPETVDYKVILRYCGVKRLFGALEKFPDGKNKMIKKERNETIKMPINSSKENAIDVLNTRLKKGNIYDDDGSNNNQYFLKEYTVDLTKSELCADTPNCLIAYLNGPNDNDCDINDDKYHDIYESVSAIYNEYNNVPPDLKPVDVNSLKENKRYFLKINIPNNNILFREYPITIRYDNNSILPLKNAIGIYKSTDTSSHNGDKFYSFNFNQFSSVKFHDSVMVREPNPKDSDGKPINNSSISIKSYIIVGAGQPKVKTLDYFSFYELPPAYDKLFSKNMFGLYRGGKRSYKKGIYKKRTNKKRSYKKRTNRRLN